MTELVSLPVPKMLEGLDWFKKGTLLPVFPVTRTRGVQEQSNKGYSVEGLLPDAGARTETFLQGKDRFRPHLEVTRSRRLGCG